MTNTKPYHAHVYFEAESKQAALDVVGKVSAQYDIAAGHFHDDPVGPHPTGSCQLTVPVNQLGEVVNWLALNRQGLTVFIHADTGDVMKDHTEHTIWMGAMPALNLDVLEKFIAKSS